MNSTSVKAWEALLRANRNLAVTMTNNNDPAGATDALLGTAFPGVKKPLTDSGADTSWSGFSRLTDNQMNDLAEQNRGSSKGSRAIYEHL